MILLQGQQLARLFGDDVLFKNIYIDIQDNSRIALVGRNGTGKSTLLKMLAGITEPSMGVVSKKKELSIGYLDQYAAIESTHTVMEEMMSVFTALEQLKKEAQKAAEKLADETVLQNEVAYQQALATYDRLQHELSEKNAYGYEGDIRSVLHGFHFEEDSYTLPITQLSGGERTRLALAKILLEKHDVLILDEPTNHLDVETLTWLESYLKNAKIALLIVSHDQYFLDAVCNEVYEIHHGEMEHYYGNYSHYLKERVERYQAREKAYEKQQKEIHKLEDFIARNIVRASTTKRAQSRRKQLEKMVKIEKPKGDKRSARFEFAIQKESGNQVLNVVDTYIGYDGAITSGPIQLQIRKQEAIAIVGPNGIGKSTFLKTLQGQLPLISGTIDFGTNVTTGYYDQNMTGLSPRNTVLDELWNEHPTMNEQDIRTILGSFLFSGEDVEKTTAQLSGGEKARLSLAKLALQHDNFLLLDEPTNHLDIDSKEVLEEALIEYDGTICFVSHDRYFINQVATSILEIDKNGSTLYLGDYDYYIEKKKEQEELAAAAAEPTQTPTKETSSSTYHLNKEEQRKIRALQRKIEQLENDMHTKEQAIEQLHEQLASEEVYSNLQKAQELQNKVETLEQEIEMLMFEWEETSLTLERESR